MKKTTIILALFTLLTLVGCKESKPSNPVAPQPPAGWQYYPDGTPGVTDLRLSIK